MMRSFKFTIQHGFAASLVLHSAIALPFVVPLGVAADPEEDETLVVALEGVESDHQADERVQQQAPSIAGREESKPERTQLAQAGEQNRTDTTDIFEAPAADRAKKPTPAEQARPGAQSDSVGISGGDDQQKAQTLREREEREEQALKVYVRALSKRVQGKLVYPEEGRQSGWQGVTTVTFTILPNGNLRADSLKVVSSSGQSKLDDSALKTIRASAPFAPPPKEISPTIGVDYGRKR